MKKKINGGISNMNNNNNNNNINSNITEEYSLPKLLYAYDALEPYYDQQTLEIHYTKHHAGYVNGLNNALAKLKEARENGNYALIKHWERELAFHGAGHTLHSLFWENLRPGKADNKPTGKILKALEGAFGSWENFTAQFKAAAIAVEGSGWGMLAKDSTGKLQILTIENHQKLFLPGMVPLLVCDVWEHAYYLKYQNKRGEWLDNFFKLIDWDDVAERLI